MHKALVWRIGALQTGLVGVCQLGDEAGESEIQGHFCLYNELEASVDYWRLYLKNKVNK